MLSFPCRNLGALIAAMLAMVATAGCGVRQFNGKVHNAPSLGRFTAGFGPFWASGQNGGSMSSPACNPNAHHPCAHARASVGMPYQFDANPNAAMGAITAGTSFPAPGPYSGTAGGPNGTGAGKTKAAPWQPTSRTDQPYAENRDLKVMHRQTSGADQVF